MDGIKLDFEEEIDKEDLKDNFDHFLDTISEKYNTLVHKGEALIEEGKDEVKNAKNQITK